MKNNSKKIIIACAIFATIMIVVSGFVMALFTARQEETKRISIGNLDVILEEDQEWEETEDPNGIEKYTKNVKGKSVAEKKAYVRMRFIPVVEYYYEAEENGTQVAEWRVAPISQEYIKVTVDTHDKWVKQGDYYYYTKILNPRETTDAMDVSWQIIEIPAPVAQYEKIRTDVRVLLEYSQTGNEIWKEIFQIDNLPEGVEKLDV